MSALLSWRAIATEYHDLAPTLPDVAKALKARIDEVLNRPSRL